MATVKKFTSSEYGVLGTGYWVRGTEYGVLNPVVDARWPTLRQKSTIGPVLN